MALLPRDILAHCFKIVWSATLGGRQEPRTDFSDRFVNASSTLCLWGKTSQSSGAIAKKNLKLRDSAQTRQPKADAPKVAPAKLRSVRQYLARLHRAARAKVSRLQAALSVLGDANIAKTENLEQALQRAQPWCLPPISELIISRDSLSGKGRDWLLRRRQFWPLSRVLKHWHRERCASQSCR